MKKMYVTSIFSVFYLFISRKRSNFADRIRA